MKHEYKALYEKFGLNVVYYRKRKRLTQLQLAELVEIDRRHISMFAAGGVCFLLIGQLGQVQPVLPWPLRAILGAGIITMVELAAGLLVNRRYQIWDYRGRPGNFLGQICPAFTLLWIPVALMAMGLYRWLDWRLDRMLGV